MDVVKDLIMWSGGLDSTSVLLKYLKEGKVFDTWYIDYRDKKYERGYDVTPLEIKAREKIKGILLKYYPPFNDTSYHVDPIDINGNLLMNRHTELAMLYAIISNLKSDSNYNSIAFGWCKDDMYFDRLTKHITLAYEELQILSVFEWHKVKWPKFVFPLANILKKDEYAKDTISKEVLNEVWSCNQPVDDRPCGQCRKCRNISKILQAL